MLFVQESRQTRLEIPFVEPRLVSRRFLTADEVILSSTPNCLLPVVSLNQQPIGGGRPGKIFRQLLEGWSKVVGV